MSRNNKKRNPKSKVKKRLFKRMEKILRNNNPKAKRLENEDLIRFIC